jgi:prevent-host-death family protein
MTATMTSRDFNQDISQAKRLADQAPVTITDRGKPAYVLMTHAMYEKLTAGGPSILDLLAHPESEHIEFDPKPLPGGRIRSAKLR